MKKIISIIFFLIIAVTVSHAERSVKGFESFDQYRQIGEYRLWTFIAKDSVIGTLVSTVKEEVSINGQSGFTIEQKLKLDYSNISTNLKFDILNSHFVSNDGLYLGDKMKITINDQTEEIDLKREGNKLQGYITRGGDKIDQDIDLGNIRFAVDNNYIDQLEMLLASLDLTVGTQIEDTIFMSQTLINSYIYGVVSDFRNIRLYNEVFDSAFIIEFTYPTMMTAVFTPDKRLVKLAVPSQELKIYQDAVANPLKAKLAAQKIAEQKKKAVQLSNKKPISELIILFFMYAIAGAIVTFFFIKSLYKRTISYISMLVGGGLFILIPLTQIPLQEYFFREYFIPHVLKGGESALQWGILPAVTAGIVQEIIKCLALIVLFKFLTTKKNQFIALGAIVGLGFGLVEATYLAYGTPSTLLFGFNLVERVFLIIFHIAAGTLIGYALKDGISKAVSFLVLTILINSIFRYMPIFAQNKTLTPELLGILMAFISISFLTFSLYLSRKEK